MKKTSAWFTFILLSLLAGCQNRGADGQTGSLVTVDVTENYPVKELILQDFMDVEYVPLETTDSFVCQGLVLDVSRNYILVRNRNSDGNLYLFDRTGKGVRVINRKGQGGEEYASANNVVLDERNGEIFVNDMYAKRILVYDLEGNFRRKLALEGDYRLGDIHDFDREHLICMNSFGEEEPAPDYREPLYLLLSKRDGTIAEQIPIPYEQKKTMVVKTYDKVNDMYYYEFGPSNLSLAPDGDGYLLADCSADTLYHYAPGGTPKPAFVRTPSVQTMDPEVFLLPGLLTERYSLLQAFEKKRYFPMTNILYDKQADALFRYKLYNGDYTERKELFLTSRSLNSEIPCWKTLDASRLVEDNKGGKLQGRLREIAATLDEEDNPVIMLIKRKR